MPRFESRDRFWEIELEDRRIQIRSGPLGSAGVATVRSAHYAAAARREYERLIATKLEQGFTQVERPRQLEEGGVEELEAAVFEQLAAGRAAHEAWAVLGDALAARGDARGELIAIDERLARQPGPGLLARRRQLLSEQAPRWLGELARLDGPGRPLGLVWDHGYLAAARVGMVLGRLDLDRWRLGARSLVPVLAELLEHPLARPLARLELAALDEHGRRDFAPAMSCLLARPRPLLRELRLGSPAMVWSRDGRGRVRRRSGWLPLGDLAALAAPELAGLRRLTLAGRQLAELPPLPAIVELELFVDRLTPELRRWLLRGPWPRLRRLWVVSELRDPWRREPGDDGPGFAELVAALRDGPLRELGIQGRTALGELAQSEPLELDELRVVQLGDAGARLLSSRCDRFAAVARLVLVDARVEGEWAALRRCFAGRLDRVRAIDSAGGRLA